MCKEILIICHHPFPFSSFGNSVSNLECILLDFTVLTALIPLLSSTCETGWKVTVKKPNTRLLDDWFSWEDTELWYFLSFGYPCYLGFFLQISFIHVPTQESVKKTRDMKKRMLTRYLPYILVYTSDPTGLRWSCVLEQLTSVTVLMYLLRRGSVCYAYCVSAFSPQCPLSEASKEPRRCCACDLVYDAEHLCAMKSKSNTVPSIASQESR